MRRWLDMIAARQSFRRIALDAGMHAAAGFVDFLPRMKQRMAATQLIEDLEYARHGGTRLKLDILQPKGPGPHPILMYLHGGAFAVGSKRTHRALAAAYASRGYLVCNVDYRLAPQYPFPAAIEDACAAWVWVTGHADRYGGDKHRMALAGESAGANLALAVVLACCTPRPESFAAPLFEHGVRPVAALLYCGFLQASRPARYQRAGVSALAARIAEDAARSYLGRSADHPGQEHALADPLCIVEAMHAPSRLPALFIAAGLNDPVAADSQDSNANSCDLGHLAVRTTTLANRMPFTSCFGARTRSAAGAIALSSCVVICLSKRSRLCAAGGTDARRAVGGPSAVIAVSSGAP